MDQQQAAPKQITVFYSYAHTDERLRKQLETHLGLLRQQGIIAEWYDRQIVPGTDWAHEIDTHLTTARVILLLISSDFIASDYCYGIELRRALERHDANEARVIPILLRPLADWDKAPFARLAVLPTNAKPIVKWRHRDDAWVNVVEGIRRAIEELEPLQMRTSVHQESPVQSPSPIGHSNVVLFDEAHGQSHWWWPRAGPTSDYGYKRIKELTQQHHYSVEFLKEKEVIRVSELWKYAAFVLPIGPEGRSGLKDEEVDAIHTYVRQGGGLLVLSHYTGDWHHEANLNQVLERYGITCNNDVVMPKDSSPRRAHDQMYEGRPNSEDLVVAQPAADDSATDRTRRELRGDLLTGVNKIATLSSCSLSIEEQDATTILRSGSESTLFVPVPTGRGIAIKEYKETGHGPVPLVGASVTHKVIAVGSWKTFLNEFLDDPDYDNRRLYENMLSWLTAQR